MSDSQTVDCNTLCTVCHRPYKWRKNYTVIARVEGRYIKDTELITAHAGCRNLLCKYQKLQAELLDTEWKLFQLQYYYL